MHTAEVALQGRKIYVTCDISPVYDAKHQVYVYDVSIDHWGQLPPPGHYKGIPHIIGENWLLLVDACLLLTE